MSSYEDKYRQVSEMLQIVFAKKIESNSLRCKVRVACSLRDKKKFIRQKRYRKSNGRE